MNFDPLQLPSEKHKCILIRTTINKDYVSISMDYIGRYEECFSCIENMIGRLMQEGWCNRVTEKNPRGAVHNALMRGLYDYTRTSHPELPLYATNFFRPDDKTQRIEFKILHYIVGEPCELVNFEDKNKRLRGLYGDMLMHYVEPKG